VSAAARELFADSYDTIAAYVDILAGRGIERGLLGPREADRLWDRHVLNSAALADLIPARASVADVGSGAGLPGLPLAILRPDLTVTLIEPLLRRATFLTETVAELGLGQRVQVVRARAEDFSGRFAVVASRAVAPLERLVGWCEPLRARDGVLLALKGQSAAAELVAAGASLQRWGLRGELLTRQPHPDAEPATVVRVSPR